MKKFGFTLAEVLITLGIIGVVAALATPALVTSAGNAKVGPSLAKAVSTFTTANEMMLAQEEVGSITPGIFAVTGRTVSLWPTLSQYMKGSILENVVMKYSGYRTGSYSPKVDGDNVIFGGGGTNSFASEDGFFYYVHLRQKVTPNASYANIPSNQLIGEVFIDINGQAKPNKIGKDLFRFYLYNDGSLKAYGSEAFDKTRKASDIKELWNLNNNCNANGVNDANTCAGSIFENNRKIIYQ